MFILITFYAYLNLFLNKFTPTLILSSTYFLFINPTNHFIIRQIESFAFQAILFYLIIGIISWYLKKKQTIFASLISSILIIYHICPTLYPTHNNLQKNGDLTFTIAHCNVYKPNQQKEALVRDILKHNPDIIGFQEVNTQWSIHLEAELKANYPYYFLQPTENVYGMALFSKYPLTDTLSLIIQNKVNIVATVTVRNKKVTLIASHVPSPMTPRKTITRTKHLADLLYIAINQAHPVILLADYNTVPWASELRDFQRNGFIPSHYGFLPTYPEWFFGAIIPIDHIYHSNQINCLNYYSIKATGSDHYALIGQYQ